MAVVFISPKKRQKMFFMAITAMFLLFLVIISFLVFLVKPNAPATALVFNKPKVDINMKIFDSDQFKGLQAFTEMQTQYSYVAMTKDNKTQTGFISANSKQDAEKKLTNMGLNVSDIKEAQIGRDDPFSPYYQMVLAPASANSK